MWTGGYTFYCTVKRMNNMLHLRQTTQKNFEYEFLAMTQKDPKIIFEYDYLAIFAGTTQKYSCPPPPPFTSLNNSVKRIVTFRRVFLPKMMFYVGNFAQIDCKNSVRPERKLWPEPGCYNLAGTGTVSTSYKADRIYNRI